MGELVAECELSLAPVEDELAAGGGLTLAAEGGLELALVVCADDVIIVDHFLLLLVSGQGVVSM